MIKNPLSYIAPPVDDEFGVSKCEPEQALTIKEIVLRVSNGMTTGVSARSYDFDEDDDEDFSDETLDQGALRQEMIDYENSLRVSIERRKQQEPPKEEPPKEEPPKQEPPKEEPPMTE